MYEIRRIDFKLLEEYWVETGHFHVPNKVITRYVDKLGPYESYGTPKITIEYGLFDDNYMIGGTQVYQFWPGVVRWRTSNIRKAYRGCDLFYKMLCTIITHDWRWNRKLIGWHRSEAYGWATRHGFSDYDGAWHDHDGDKYIMVYKRIADMIDDFTNQSSLDPEGVMMEREIVSV